MAICRFLNRWLIAFGVLSGCLVLQGCIFTNWLLKNDLEQLQQEATGEIQGKRALAINEQSLREMKSVDLILNIPQDLVERSYDKIIKALNDDDQIKKENIHVLDFKLVPDAQELRALVKLEKKVNDYKVTATVHCSAYIATYKDVIYFNVVGRFLKVDRVEDGHLSFLISSVAKSLNPLLNGVVPVVNIALDRRINQNPDKTSLRRFKFAPLWEKSKRDELAERKGIVIGPETREFNVSISRLLSRIDRRNITLLATVSPTKADDQIPLVPLPPDQALVEIPQGLAAERVSAYQSSVDNLINKTIGEDMVSKQFNATAAGFVTKASLAKLVNSITDTGAITVAGTYPGKTENKTIPIVLPIPNIECDKHVTVCKYKNTCSGDNCEQSIAVSGLDTVCEAQCCSTAGLVGCAIPPVRDSCRQLCTTVSNTLRPIAGAFCDGFRTAGSVIPGLCASAGLLNSATCTAIDAVSAGLCATISTIKSYYDTHPIADIDAYLKVESLPFSGTVNSLEVSEDLSKVKFAATVNASGPLSYGLHYKRLLTPTDIVLPAGLLQSPCTFNWSGDYSVNASASVSKTLEFKLLPTERRDQVLKNKAVLKDADMVLKFESEEWVAHLNFSPSPLQELAAKDPHAIFNCPIATIGTLAYGAGEKVFSKEDARIVWPLLTGENLPVTVKPQTLQLVVPTIELRNSSHSIELIPTMKGKGILFLGSALH